MDLYQSELESPLGVVYVVSDGIHVRAVDFEGYEDRLQRLLARHYGRYALHATSKPGEAVSRLEDYFAGEVRAINAIPVATGGTPFQRQVWAALRTIPAGTTVSYGTIAAQIGRPTACRAVGLANGSNPIGIVVPCHRVIGANHGLTGYGGGLERKQWLLEHEGAVPAADSTHSKCSTVGVDSPSAVDHALRGF
ncbi:MAG TPA: methylated-DNA--[protein]-cysteine S-methyltransferase [Pirellulales bacterium]|nr:methylated-DNA--[protein]-cysteine S-methyltransferase [Pirellulales bacterium]